MLIIVTTEAHYSTVRKHGLIVCKWRPCLPKGRRNSARMRTIVTAAVQRQYLQTELMNTPRSQY
jgi:hypothetical protein